jgi:hypothetical protein
MPISFRAKSVAKVEGCLTRLRPLRRREVAQGEARSDMRSNWSRQAATAGGRSDILPAVPANGCRNEIARSIAFSAPRSNSSNSFRAVPRSPEFTQYIFIEG